MKKIVLTLIIIGIIILIGILLFYFFGRESQGSHECKGENNCVALGGCHPGCWNKNNLPRDYIWNQQMCGMKAPENCGCIENICVADYGSYAAKLLSFSGGSFVESASFYEGELTMDITNKMMTGVPYSDLMNQSSHKSVFVCTTSWSWVKVGSCYELNELEIQRNQAEHKYSIGLSGCYIGSFKEISCT